MKSSEEKPKNKEANENRNNKEEITSESIQNAHATGDGAVQKTDEFLPKEENDKKPPNSNPY